MGNWYKTKSRSHLNILVKNYNKYITYATNLYLYLCDLKRTLSFRTHKTCSLMEYILHLYTSTASLNINIYYLLHVLLRGKHFFISFWIVKCQLSLSVVGVFMDVATIPTFQAKRLIYMDYTMVSWSQINSISTSVVKKYDVNN